MDIYMVYVQVIYVVLALAKSSAIDIKSFQPAIIPIHSVTKLTIVTADRINSTSSIQCRFNDISMPAQLSNNLVFCDTPPMRKTDRAVLHLDVDGKLHKAKTPLRFHEPFKVTGMTPMVVIPSQQLHININGITCKYWMTFFVRFQTVNGSERTRKGICENSTVTCFVPEFPPRTMLRVGVTLSNRIVEWSLTKLLVQYPIDSKKSLIKDLSRDIQRKGAFTFKVVLRDKFKNSLKIDKVSDCGGFYVQYSPYDSPDTFLFPSCDIHVANELRGSELLVSCSGAKQERIQVYPLINNVVVGEKSSYEVKTTLCPGKPSCSACSLDVAFLVDSSGSVGNNYETEKDFVKQMATYVEIPIKSRGAVIVFGTNAQISIDLQDAKTLAHFKSLVQKIPFLRSLTRIDRALLLAAKNVFPKARPNVVKVAVVLTDGQQTQAPGVSLPNAARSLHDIGVRVIAVGIGYGVSKKELYQMVQSPNDVVLVSNFDSLTKKAQDISKYLCKLPNPAANQPSSLHHPQPLKTGNTEKTKDNLAAIVVSCMMVALVVIIVAVSYKFRAFIQQKIYFWKLKRTSTAIEEDQFMQELQTERVPPTSNDKHPLLDVNDAALLTTEETACEETARKETNEISKSAINNVTKRVDNSADTSDEPFEVIRVDTAMLLPNQSDDARGTETEKASEEKMECSTKTVEGTREDNTVKQLQQDSEFSYVNEVADSSEEEAEVSVKQKLFRLESKKEHSAENDPNTEADDEKDELKFFYANDSSEEEEENDGPLIK